MSSLMKSTVTGRPSLMAPSLSMLRTSRKYVSPPSVEYPALRRQHDEKNLNRIAVGLVDMATFYKLGEKVERTQIPDKIDEK